MRAFFVVTALMTVFVGPVSGGCEDSLVFEQSGEYAAVGCTPGQEQQCRCPGGRAGFQFCTEAGRAWSECFCCGGREAGPCGGELDEGADQGDARQDTKLAVVWYSDDPYVAERVCLMYTHNAKLMGWFDTVELIVWGPSQKLLVEDSDVQSTVAQMMSDGVIVEACRACADLYGITSQLEALGITVKYMGEPLTNMLQSDWEVLTF